MTNILRQRSSQPVSVVTKPGVKVLGSNFPTSTMVQLVALAWPELLLEINAIPVIPCCHKEFDWMNAHAQGKPRSCFDMTKRPVKYSQESMGRD
jgi:hypothetical protein